MSDDLSHIGPILGAICLQTSMFKHVGPAAMSVQLAWKRPAFARHDVFANWR